MQSTDIKAIRKRLNLNQTDFGKLIGASLRSVQMYEKGNTKPSADVLIKILELDMQDSSHKVEPLLNEPEPIYNKNGNKYIELKDHTYDVEVPLIPFTAYASFLESCETGTVNEDFETMTFNVDRVGRGNYKAFITKGDSMNGGRINDTPDGAKVLGRELGKQHWKDGFRDSDYGWIIMCKKNIFHKDIIDYNANTGEVTLHSRNDSPEYSDFQLSLNDCYYIFKVIKRIF